MNRRLILTCEHAGRRVPAAYRSLFRDADDVLSSHRGWDPGSLSLGRTIRRVAAAPLYYVTVTRLLVELNRSLNHPKLFSEFTSALDPTVRQSILRRFYHPHRDRVEERIGREIGRHQVVHLSLHTFTPDWNGAPRNADVGLLYDPRRHAERLFCDRWHRALADRRPDLRIRRNYPYRGSADGLTTYLRRRFPTGYLGLELEVNQLWLAGSAARWRRLRRDLAESLVEVTKMDG